MHEDELERITRITHQEYPFEDGKQKRTRQGQPRRRTKSDPSSSSGTRNTTTATDYDNAFEQARDTSAASSPHAYQIQTPSQHIQPSESTTRP
ncbi:hypothetical protein Hypma_004074 [Hypsizygus marmoreus]|uniref:Uncharacterized protein n=1 Tax=Hypsizygus marmoreus TaxID=39966 RepID=A0A369J353_HYPMA|nr:hypothetical protein Hypma_004074 [Hypsizygus marmoreus]